MQDVTKRKILRAVVIDDDPMTHRYLDVVFKRNMDFIRLVGRAFGLKEGLEMIEKEKPDIVFTDIEMPDGSGFDLIDSFPEPSFAYVMLSSEIAYAERVSAYGALSFFSKPISVNSLTRCMAAFYTSLS